MEKAMRRVIVAEDYLPIREICQRLLADDADVVAVVGTGEDAVREANTHRPDVVVLDISMPGMNGLQAARLIRSALPAVAILFLSSHTSSAYVDAAREIGACGFVFKQRLVQDLHQAIESIDSGKFFVSALPAHASGRERAH